MLGLLHVDVEPGHFSFSESFQNYRKGFIPNLVMYVHINRNQLIYICVLIYQGGDLVAD